MNKSNKEIQLRLIELGHPVGQAGADGKIGKDTRKAISSFQKSVGLRETGEINDETLEALFPTPANKPQSLPASWLPAADMDRVIVHWTAGSHRATTVDKEHYHVLWEGDGTAVRGTPSIAKNDAGGVKAGHAAHTLHCNTGSVGVSMCAMMGAIESPFSPGPAPLTEKQWDAMVLGVADICIRYGIPVTDRTVLTHAEVQPNLGIRQRGKWDITRLPFRSAIVGHRAVGDLLRQQVAAAITKQR